MKNLKVYYKFSLSWQKICIQLMQHIFHMNKRKEKKRIIFPPVNQSKEKKHTAILYMRQQKYITLRKYFLAEEQKRRTRNPQKQFHLIQIPENITFSYKPW